MAKKRKNWLKRLLGITLAVALVVQPMSTQLGSVSVVHAAEGETTETPEMTELITNGDFSDVSPDGGSATNWEGRKEGETSVKFENGKVVFDIRTMGDDWANYLKYTLGIDLKNGQDYIISFTAMSSVDRTIQFGFDGDRIGITTKDLTAGEETQVSYTYKAAQDYDANPFMIYLGNIKDVTNPTESHTIEISNVSIKTAAGSGSGGGDEGPDTPGVVKPAVPIGLEAKYWETDDANKGKIWVSWSADFGDGGKPDSWTISIDGKELQTVNAVAACFFENTYAAGDHTVTLKATNAAGSSTKTVTFTLTEAQAGGTDAPGDDYVPPVEGNLLTNGNFADKGEGWQPFNGNVNVDITYKQYSVEFDIKADAVDYMQAICQPVSVVAGATYKVSFDVESTVARSVTAGFDPSRDHTESIEANTKTTVSYEVKPNATGTPSFFLYMGTGDGSGVGAHTVTVSNVSIVKIADASGGENPGGGGDNPGDDADTEDGEYVAPVEGNLLKNGNFEDKNESWSDFKDFTNIYYNKYRTVFQINGETGSDYGQGLYQVVRLESGMNYKVSFDIETTVARTVTVDINDTGREFTSDVIPANEKTTVSYVTSDVNNGDNKFFIYLGGVKGLGKHKVVISNVSIVEVPLELPNDENDEPYTAITSIGGLSVYDAIALKDGNFTNELDKWDTWCESWMQQWNTVRYTPVENGMNVYIENTGGGAGNKAWDAQMNQHIDLKKGLQYTISFDVHTEKARAINVVINELATGDFIRTVGLQKDETRHVVFNIPVQSVDALDKLFSIQMGNVAGDVQQNTLTFSNMRIEVNGYEDLAVLIDDGEFTEGLGSFTAKTANTATVNAVEKSILAEMTADTKAEDVTLTKSGLALEAGVAYTVSFVAGAVSGNRTITVQLPDGTSKEIVLTSDATAYTVEFTPASNVAAGDLVFKLGGAADTICLDTVRLDVKGFAEAKGLNISRHDIARLIKNKAPVISEHVSPVVGEDIVLTFVDADGAYTAAITEAIAKGISPVLIDGAPVAADKYNIEKGKITLDKSLFTFSGSERKTFYIQVNAYWYEPGNAIQIVYATKQWQSTWADEFGGTTLNMDNWSYQNGTGAEYGLDGWGNSEQQYYTDENLKVEDGTLVITATSDNRGGKPYSSARIWTMNDDKQTAKFSQTYGRFEAKMKLPAGEGCQGLWPAFWLLPVDSPYGGWPVSGEIDIMEARGRQADRIDSTLHFGRDYPNEATAGSHYGDEEWEELDITEYHIYSVDWTPTYMSFQVDGIEFYRVANWFCQNESEPQQYAFPAPFDQEFYVILNLAVGGMYDEYRNPSASALPAEMKVDYVRVYQSTDPNLSSDSYIAPDPEMEKDEDSSSVVGKNQFVDSEFANVKLVTKDEENVEYKGWKLLTLPQFGGSADCETVEIDGETFAKINISSAGNAEHSIQMTQNLSLYKGHWYTLSFDAKADEGRSLISKIGTDGSITGKWTTFNAITTKLTTDVKHYEYTFQMMNESDPISRLELNMGANGTAAVYLANIEFKEVSGYYINPDVPKGPLENGNHIYNGAFMLGNTSRMAYWQVSDGVSGVVRKGNEYYFRSQKATDLYQTGLELLQSDTYKLTFDAKADAAQEITVVFSDKNGNTVYTSRTVSVGTAAENKEVTFTMPAGVTDKDGVLTFKLGAGVELDNIVLKRTTYNNVDYTGLNCYPLPNGDFEMDDYGWSTWQTSLTIVTDAEGNKIGRVGGATTAHRYDATLSYSDLELVGGYDYELSFEAKANRDAVIDVTLEDGSYNRYFAQTDISVGTDWQTYTYDFKLSGNMTLALKFLTGGAQAAYNLDLDNIVLKMKGAPEASGVFMPNAYNKLGENVVIAHNGTSAWCNKAVVKLDGEVVDADKYTLVEGSITLDKSLFTESREYAISATAEGYADSTEMKFKVYPANGDRICNGDFVSGDSAWEQYIHGGDSADLDYSKGYVDARYLHAEGDEWGNPSVPWSIQVNQSLTVDEAGNYDISFVARSEVERYIMVTIDEQTTKVKLTRDAQVYTVTVNIARAGSYKLQFQMGTVHPTVGNGYFPVEGFEDIEAHNFYLDSVSMLPAGTTVDKSDSEVFDIVFHDHTGGEATCTSPAICDECGLPYGKVDKDNHTGGTEIRDAKEATDTAEGYTGDTYCKGCGTKLATGQAIPKKEHTHTGGKATCTSPATCTVCGKTYGEKDSSNHTGGTEIRGAKEATVTAEGYTGDTYCKGCGAKIATGKAIPKKAHTHTGGKATCTAKAKCSVCGESYGNVDKNNHTGGTEVRGKVAATATKDGYTGDTYCKGCGTKLSTGKTIPKTGSGNTGNTGNTDKPSVKNGWEEKSGAKYWYENGVKQGTEGRGKEIYDPASDAWYWLDAPNGVMAANKDVYQESLAGDWGDYFNENGERCGKWVRYDANGHMVKGWQDTENGTYFFDYTYGTMAKGFATIEGKEYYFNPATGVLEYEIGEVPENGWKNIDGKDYWYENYIRQGYSVDESYRGKEIYDGASDAWYWLDNVQGGAKAVSKDVYQESLAGDWGDYTNADGERCGKWVRYDENGHMIKGWQDTENGTYFFDYTYGTMAKGSANIDGVEYYFDSATGIRQ